MERDVETIVRRAPVKVVGRAREPSYSHIVSEVKRKPDNLNFVQCDRQIGPCAVKIFVNGQALRATNYESRHEACSYRPPTGKRFGCHLPLCSPLCRLTRTCTGFKAMGMYREGKQRWPIEASVIDATGSYIFR